MGKTELNFDYLLGAGRNVVGWNSTNDVRALFSHSAAEARAGRREVRTRDLCCDSTEAGSNLLKLRVTDGFFWRSEIPLVTVIGPLSDPRPLLCRPLPKPSPWVLCTGGDWRAELGD